MSSHIHPSIAAPAKPAAASCPNFSGVTPPKAITFLLEILSLRSLMSNAEW